MSATVLHARLGCNLQPIQPPACGSLLVRSVFYACALLERLNYLSVIPKQLCGVGPPGLQLAQAISRDNLRPKERLGHGLLSAALCQVRAGHRGGPLQRCLKASHGVAASPISRRKPVADAPKDLQDKVAGSHSRC